MRSRLDAENAEVDEIDHSASAIEAVLVRSQGIADRCGVHMLLQNKSREECAVPFDMRAFITESAYNADLPPVSSLVPISKNRLFDQSSNVSSSMFAIEYDFKYLNLFSVSRTLTCEYGH